MKHLARFLMPAVLILYMAQPVAAELVAHWSFDSFDASGNAPDESGNGFTALLHKIDATLTTPTVVEGFITGSTYAADFTSGKMAFKVQDPYSGSPNFAGFANGLSVAVWLKTPVAGGGNKTFILGAADLQFRYLVAGETIKFKSEVEPTYSTTTFAVNDGAWHHVVAVIDPVNMVQKIYLDGVKNAQLPITGALTAYGGEVTIGINQALAAAKVPNAYIDDLRVFNHPLTEEEIDTLVGEGDIMPPVMVSAPLFMHHRLVDGDLLLDAAIEAYDPQTDTITWSKTRSMPDPNASVRFASPDAEDTYATFEKEGTYELTLTVEQDGTVYSDWVWVDVIKPCCFDAILDGKILPGDINLDCRISFGDFAEIVRDWLRCYDPQDAACEDFFFYDD